MKLCDRCGVSGCCLSYLGKSCENARKRACPDVQPNNAELISYMGLDEMAKYLAEYISDIWVDAKITPAEVREWLTEEPKM